MPHSAEGFTATILWPSLRSSDRYCHRGLKTLLRPQFHSLEFQGEDAVAEISGYLLEVIYKIYTPKANITLCVN